MNIKTLILVIILSVLVGFGLFFGEKLLKNKSLIGSQITKQQNSELTPTEEPSPSPLPTLPPLTKDSNLLNEAEKLTIPDFSSEYSSLKEEVNNL